jgi:hypothetical protein
VIIGRGTEADPMALLLYTRKRRFVMNEMSPERSADELDSLEKLFRDVHPQATLRSNTSTYNCMGLVFAARRTHIDVDLLDAFLADDEWRQLADVASLQAGDVVIYRLNGRRSHVGVVSRLRQDGTIVMLSKWGDAGEYFHEIRDVPAFCGVPSEYYTDRKGGL